MKLPRANNIFKILVQGHFPRSKVLLKWHPSSRQLPEEIQKQIEIFWQKEIIQTNKNSHIFNGKLVRLNDWSIQNELLTLDMGLTDYKELLYSNHNLKNLQKHGKWALSRALGVSVVFETCDKQILLIERSQKVGEFPGCLDVLGGHIDPDNDRVNDVPDPFFAIKNEIKEEIKISFEENAPLVCLGLIETVSTRKPEMVFWTRSKYSAREILTMNADNSSEEFVRLFSIENDPDTLQAVLLNWRTPWSPSAYGVLNLYLKALEEKEIGKQL